MIDWENHFEFVSTKNNSCLIINNVIRVKNLGFLMNTTVIITVKRSNFLMNCVLKTFLNLSTGQRL